MNSEPVQPVQLARQINLRRYSVNKQGVHSLTICKLLYRTQAISSRFLLWSNYNNLVDNVNSEIDCLHYLCFCFLYSFSSVLAENCFMCVLIKYNFSSN